MDMSGGRPVGGSCMKKPTAVVSPMSRSPPDSGREPATRFRSVLLPAPFGPTTPILSPGKNSYQKSLQWYKEHENIKSCLPSRKLQPSNLLWKYLQALRSRVGSS